ncbi:NlpC/P60 family protein [Flavobacteriaceae bacterium Ap0902]|nr:NlpC/P60 family protein [Flavobacteriaceae bacterium Ap0902]
MQKIYILILSIFLLISCGTNRARKVDNSVSGRAKTVLSKAYDFYGTPYQYGGTTRKGMDCSGLALVSFAEVGIELPRNSAKQAEYGIKVNIKRVEPGDMLFFNTSGRGISHAGIVDHIKDGEVFFIHASSSKGVMVSSLENSYWNKRFVKAVRYIY